MGPIISHLVSFVYLVLTEQMFCGILLIGSDRWGSRCLLFFPGFNSLNRDRNSHRVPPVAFSLLVCILSA